MPVTPLYARPVPRETVLTAEHLHDSCRLEECIRHCRAVLAGADTLPDRRPGPGELPVERVTVMLLLAEVYWSVSEAGTRLMPLFVTRQWIHPDHFLVHFFRAGRKSNQGLNHKVLKDDIPVLRELAGSCSRWHSLVDLLELNVKRYAGDDVCDHYRQISHRFLTQGNMPRFMMSSEALAENLCLHGRFSEAYGIGMQILHLAVKYGMKHRINGSLITLTIACNKQGDPRQSLDLVQKYFDPAYGSSTIIAAVTLLRARAHEILEEWDPAEKLTRESLEIARLHGFLRNAALSLETLGDIALSRGDLESARHLFADATALHRKLKPVSGDVAGMLRRHGSWLLAAGDPAAATPVLEEALAMAERTGEVFEYGLALRELARGRRQLEQYPAALNAARRSLRRFERMGARLEAARSHLEVGRTAAAWTTARQRDPDGVAAPPASSPLTLEEIAWAAAADAHRLFAGAELTGGVAIAEALVNELRQRGTGTRNHAVTTVTPPHTFIAESSAMRQVVSWITMAAGSQDPVLLLGESGTGKEAAARRIHEQSQRRHGPFVVVNCGAIPSSLFERELFGHAAGAYTGAADGADGLLAQAEGGTLLLDEIGDLPFSLQAKLLRVLQDGVYRRLGDPTDRRADVRFMAATSADLPGMVREGRFRSDLYYRLNTVEITLPPLRQRPADLQALIRHLLNQAGCPPPQSKQLFHPGVQRALQRYTWPGNIRELETVIRRLVLLARHHGQVTLDMLPATIRAAARNTEEMDDSLHLAARLAEHERTLIGEALERAGGNRTRAAQLLGIHRQQLYRRMAALGMQLPSVPVPRQLEDQG